MTEAMIRLRNVSKVFPGTSAPAVDGLSLEIPRGEIVMLVGPSGCGKTTSLKMINRLIEPTSGSIEVDGVDVLRADPRRLRRSIGYVIQRIGLFPHRTIAENIATVPRLLGWERERIDLRVAELIDVMHLDPDLAGRYPAELSGGQQQRVGVARALAADPPVLLMDEPFGAVDPIVRSVLQDQLLELQSTLGKTIVFVTHDIDEAIKLGDRIAILNAGARLEQYGTPEDILRRPASSFVEDFLGGERGLKRLSLISVADIGWEEAPLVDRAASAEEIEAAMRNCGTEWVAVTADGRLLGWVPAAGGARLADVRPFPVRVAPDASLRRALDAVVSNPAQVAMVVDGERPLGMITLDRLSREIAR